jgi:hypothetical protein
MTTKQPSRVVIGTVVITLLGMVFGMALIAAGSFMTWRSDSVLGLYSQSGWSFDNIVSGDGKISFVLALIGFTVLVLGGALRRRAFYGISFLCLLAILALDVYELIFLWTRPGVVSPGTGLYALLGGCVAGLLCSLGGYFMVGTRHAGAEGITIDENA